MTLSTALQIFAAVLLLADFVTLGLAAFNCSRIGTGCQNQGICEGGKCICIGSVYQGYDCSQERQLVMQGACLSNNPCRNGGTCFDMALPGSANSAQCYCPYDFYGQYCELPTVFNECFADQMIVNINPGYNFIGAVGIQHKAGICDLTPVKAQVEFSLDPVRQNWQGFAAVLPFNGAMCGDGPKVNTTPTEITYTYDVLVRYDITGASPDLDEVISFSCSVPNTGQTGHNRPTAVLFTVTDAKGAFVDKPKLGSPFTINFNVEPTSIFKDLSVKSCEVFNSNKTMSTQVVHNSCPVSPFGKSLVKQADKHVLTLVTHTFGPDPSLSFECSVKVCTATDTSCQIQPVCPTPSALAALMKAGPVDPNVPTGTDLLSLLAVGGYGGSLGDLLVPAGTAGGAGAPAPGGGGGGGGATAHGAGGGATAPGAGGGATAPGGGAAAPGGGSSSLLDLLQGVGGAANALSDLMAASGGAGPGALDASLNNLLGSGSLMDLLSPQPVPASAPVPGPVPAPADGGMGGMLSRKARDLTNAVTGSSGSVVIVQGSFV